MTDTRSTSASSIIDMDAFQAAVNRRAADQAAAEKTTVQEILDDADAMFEDVAYELTCSKKQAFDVFNDHDASFADKQAAAEAYQEAMRSIVDSMGAGFSTSGASMPQLTSVQQQAIDDIDSGRLFIRTDRTWGDREYRRLRNASTQTSSTDTDGTGSTAPAATPVPPTAPTAPTAPATPATTDPPKRGGVLRVLEDVVAGLSREDPSTRRGQHR